MDRCLEPTADRIAQMLRRYTTAVERGTGCSVGRSVAIVGGTDIKMEFNRLRRLLADSAGVPAGVVTRLRLYIELGQITRSGASCKVSATAELDARCRDGSHLFASLPVSIDIGLIRRAWTVSLVAYDFDRAAVSVGAGWRRSVELAIEMLREAHPHRRVPSRALLMVSKQLLPPVISLGVEYGRTCEFERAILDWALDRAIGRWNRALAGVCRLYRLDPSASPAILIRAVQEPVQGTSIGDCTSAAEPRRSEYSLAEIRIVTTVSLDPQPLALSPESMQNCLEHELGHAFGLADAARAGHLMSGQPWNAEFPSPGTYETVSIERQQTLLRRFTYEYGYSARQPDRQQADKAMLTMCLARLPVVRRCGASRSELAPPDQWDARIWRGEGLVRSGQLAEAIREFEISAGMAPVRTEADVRRHIVSVLRDDEPTSSIGALESALRLRRRSWHAAGNAHINLVLSYAYARIGKPMNAEICASNAAWIDATSLLTVLIAKGEKASAARRVASILASASGVVFSGLDLARCRVVWFLFGARGVSSSIK